AELGVLGRVVVVRGARGVRVAVRVGRDVRARAGRAAGRGAAALELLDVARRLQRHALLGVRERLQRGLVHVEVGVDLDLGLARAERLDEQRVELGLELAIEAGLGGLLGRAARAGARAVAGRPQELARAVGDRHVVGLEALDRGGGELGDAP